MKKLAMSCLIAAGATGCQAIGGPGSVMWMSTADWETKLAHYKKVCAGYGYKPNDPGMKQCIQMTDINYKNSADAEARELNRSLAQIGQNRPTYTTCNSYGSFSVTCTSY